MSDSVMGYLGRSMIQVEPLPDGAAVIYTKEPDPKEGAMSRERIS